MLAGKKLTEYTNLFCPHDFKKNDNIILSYFKNNSIEAIDKTNLSEQAKFRLDEINKIENYFIKEINQRKTCSKKVNKYVGVFDCIDQALIVLSATSCGLSIISFTTIVSALVGIAKFLCWLKVNSVALNINISSINWHGYKSWRIYYNFEGERKIWKNERQFNKWKWKIAWNYETE